MTGRGPIIEAIHHRVTRLRRSSRRSVSTRGAIEIAVIVYATPAMFAALLPVGG